ncbi:sigma 54-interacting transcriptional regulator [Desulfobulbus sp.]|uniref:sigma-54 interaction domain-containing protein n=1 Tax=Desulfobulbus sp. TaxID=895 RepID=UPI00286F811F|nr:sigma 54-interacting transcriptional regulator [Desulfobulbus sp.]
MDGKDDFFREVTIRICSSLDIKTAFRKSFDYLKLYFPLDILSLTIFDPDMTAIRRVAHVTAHDTVTPDELVPLPKKVWKDIQKLRPKVPTIIDANTSEYYRLLAPYVQLEGNSRMSLPLLLDEKLLGSLSLCAFGEGRYHAKHLDLLATVSVPFAISLANTLSYEKVVRYKDRLIDDNYFLHREIAKKASGDIIGADGGLKNVFEMVKHVAPLSSTVLLLGETGTGKEIIANAIYHASPRQNGPFIKVNCGAIPENLIDSELFGHEKGAFTGAFGEKRGRFERADGGTIFLDEIGELPHQAQVRLLRVLQSHEIERIGGTRSIPVNIRVIAATHRNLENMVADKKFREDLWFRLNIFPIIIPPLRQRRGDISQLIHYFIRQKTLELGLDAPRQIAPGAMDRLVAYDWPGNVRELQNLVERELILHREGGLLFNGVQPTEDSRAAIGGHKTAGRQLPLRLDEVIAWHLRTVLDLTNGRVNGPNGAAELLGMHPSTLRWRLDKLGIPHGRQGRQ